MGAIKKHYDIKTDGLVKSPKIPFSVIPAKAGIQSFQAVADHLDSGFHRSDDFLRDRQNCSPANPFSRYRHRPDLSQGSGY